MYCEVVGHPPAPLHEGQWPKWINHLYPYLSITIRISICFVFLFYWFGFVVVVFLTHFFNHTNHRIKTEGLLTFTYTECIFFFFICCQHFGFKLKVFSPKIWIMYTLYIYNLYNFSYGFIDNDFYGFLFSFSFFPWKIMIYMVIAFEWLKCIMSHRNVCTKYCLFTVPEWLLITSFMLWLFNHYVSIMIMKWYLPLASVLSNKMGTCMTWCELKLNW